MEDGTLHTEHSKQRQLHFDQVNLKHRKWTY